MGTHPSDQESVSAQAKQAVAYEYYNMGNCLFQ